MKRERRSPDRPVKRMRQLHARLDVLLREAQVLRSREDAFRSLSEDDARPGGGDRSRFGTDQGAGE